jgi:hypothetical protein
MQMPFIFLNKHSNGTSTPVLLLFLFLLSFNGFSQQFNRENIDEFITQLSFIPASAERDAKDEAQNVIDSLSLLLRNEAFNATQKELIFNTLETMQNLRLRPWPEQGLYLNGLISILETKESQINFDVWHQSFQPFLTIQTQARLIKFWKTSLNLFQKNIMFSTNQVSWVMQNNNYVLSYEDNIPRIIFNGGDIKCYAQDDSTLIYNTSGEIHILEEVFYGKKGKLTWERVELHPDSVFAMLGNYRIPLTNSNWEADSVAFYNLHFFQEPLDGKLTERIIAEMNAESSRFPRFESYQSIHEIKDLYKGVDFRGGFTMTGARVLGSGTAFDDATINIYRNDSLFITARGKSFSILKDRITTQKAAVSIYLSGDSIYHPNINMRYLDSSREFSLLRDEKGFSRAPFSNSFHQIDMFCEAIYWNIDTYQIDLRMVRSISETGEAFFESNNYFSDVRYMRMQGMSDLHPLIKLRNFGRDYKSNTFFIAEYAKYLRTDLGSVTAQLLTFSQDGFLFFNQDDETVTLTDKLFHYITAYTGRSDFDVIRINSHAPINARLNMNNFDLLLFGVERIPLSNKKNVVIHPKNRQVTMKKGRDIYFDGRIESGLFDFFGKEFFFNYDQFKIELLQTDSMSFRVRSLEPDSRGNYSLVRVQTVLEGINGELLVDHPRNKSGQMPYPRFPIFNSNNESFVYYDRETVQEGVYKREDVFFKLIPFSIDSLDNATTNNIAFDGVFISTGIFPDFYDYLTVQNDYSLGFNTQTPDDGYTIYNGKAVYKGPIDMSYEGLRADGELTYLNSTINARMMLLFPDSARATVDLFNLKAQSEGIEFPEVTAMEVNMLYLPHDDIMSIENTEYPFELYGGLAFLNGSIGMSPEGLTGSGSLEFFGGQMLSKEFDFNLIDFDADKTTLTLLTADGKNPAIVASNYTSNVNFETNLTELRIIEDESKLDFSLNRFQAVGYDLDWEMTDKKVVMTNNLRDEILPLGTPPAEYWIDYNFTGNELISVHPAQDELKFYAGVVDYDLAENIIRASEVKIIFVADAAIYPDDEKINILERAEFEKLENALVIANTTSQLHRFYNAGLNIISRWDYSGSGMYDYEDETGRIQPITFDRIEVDRAYQTTIATAEIAKENDFTISPRFGYYGDLILKSESSNFTYNGAANIFVDCPGYNPNWMRFEAELQKDSIFIPLAEELKSDANVTMVAAMMLAGDSVHIYPAVFDRKKHYSDIPIISATGYLTFDKERGQYQISTAEKLLKSSLPDNIITINPNTCIIEGNGDVTLSADLGQFKTTTFGKVSHDLKQNTINLDLVFGIDFFFLNPALAMVEGNIRESKKTTHLNLNRFKYTSFLHKKTDEETAQLLMNEFLTDSAFSRFPVQLDHTMFFADVKMVWDQNQLTFYSKGALGLANMERFPMNKYVDGFMELKKARNGDIFNLVLIPSGLADDGVGSDWFFFTYTKGIMQTIAANNEFNNMIRNVKPNNRRMEVERGQEPFSFILASDRRPFDFVRSMRMMK